MNNFVFKIFGAPYTFNLYQGNEGEIGYFQNFDNGGKENVKLTIHRMASGKVSYSYLRYNFISSGGRPNSFFGMSVLFDKEYCKDIKKIFELFNVVYNSVILKNGILLTEIKNDPTVQAKYLVSTFTEADGEVKNIEKNIINNLKNHFAKDILPIDSSFGESNSMVKLNDEMDNAQFVKALRKCSWVHISPEYSKNAEPIPNPEFSKNIEDTIVEAQEQIPIISVDALKGMHIQKEANNYLGKTNESLEKILTWLRTEYKLQKGADPNSYLQKQPELKKSYDQLLAIQKLLKDLLNHVGTTPSIQEPEPNVPPGDTPSEPPKQNPDRPKPWPIIYFLEKHGLKVVAAFFVVTLIYVVFFLISKPSGKMIRNNEGPETATLDSTEKWVAEGNLALQNKKFDIAISKFIQAGDTTLIAKAKRKAVEYWYAQAANAKTPQDAIDLLKKTENYGNDPSVFVAEYQQEIDQQIANVAAAKRKRQQMEAQQKAKANDAKAKEVKTNEERQLQQTAPTYTDVKIQLSSTKRIFRIGDKFQATAKSGTITCTGGEWKFEDGLFVDKVSNPTQVEIKSVPSGGKAVLRYYIGNEQKAGTEIKIIQ